MNKKTIFVLVSISIISVLLTLVQKNPTPPCFNADEASFGYNAYSILKTGKDEYGAILPLRLKSFGDYKMPLYTYLTIPFIALFGLNEFSARFLNVILSALLPFVVYLLTVELFKNKRIGLLSAFLTSVSLGLHIISRQAHEAYLATTLTTITVYLFLKVIHSYRIKWILLFLCSSLFLLFSYHPGRIFVAFLLGFSVLYTIKNGKKINSISPLFSLLLLVLIGLFTLTDFAYKPERLKNLAFFNNAGFTLKVNELKIEGGIRYLYQPVFIGIKDIVQDHLSYFSPQFIFNGDENNRFGYKEMSIMTTIEYLFFIIGLYYIFNNKEKWRWFLLTLLFVSPLSASLSWSKGSLTRSLFILIPMTTLSAYGFYHLLSNSKKQIKPFVVFFSLSFFMFFLIFTWDFYLFHYSKRLVTIHSWQCGYKEVNSFIQQNYNKYDKFYMTKEIGMPYIFTLFYLQYPPGKYQQQASLTKADEYGFGQVEQFDKFIFSFKSPELSEKNSVVIGSVDDFKGLKNVDISKLQTVTVNGEPMFQISGNK